MTTYARYEHLLADAREAALPDEAYEGVCPVCHGILDGYCGFPGEWPCECRAEYDDTLDVEVAQLRRAEDASHD